jgi:hypothetical protein
MNDRIEIGDEVLVTFYSDEQQLRGTVQHIPLSAGQLWIIKGRDGAINCLGAFSIIRKEQ